MTRRGAGPASCPSAFRGMVLVGLLGCGAAAAERPLPEAPDVTPTFVTPPRAWSIISDRVTTGDDVISFTLLLPTGVGSAEAAVDDSQPVRLKRDASGRATGRLPIRTLPAGRHVLRVSAGVERVTVPFVRSAPVYVVLTTDWDGADPGDDALARLSTLRDRHPGLRITHFVGPSSFTDPEVSPARRRSLAAWLRRQESESGDETALHLHPYCTFVQQAGVACLTAPSTDAPDDPTGYSVRVGAYSRGDLRRLLRSAETLFARYGLGRPRAFRAGGWTATADTLATLADSGFRIDASAINWSRIEEWEHAPSGDLYAWIARQWRSIGDSSQPYRPNRRDPLSSAPPRLPLLEVPGNGVMADYLGDDELPPLFSRTWDGAPATTPRVFTTGLHPGPWLTAEQVARIDRFLTGTDTHLASHGHGPIVYVTMSALGRVFPRRQP